jgi:HK97 family phage major capsid protein
MEKLVEKLREYFPLKADFDRVVAEIRSGARTNVERGNGFSFSTFLRGTLAMQGRDVNSGTRDADVNYVRALTTGTTPGSYLVPTIQANEVIGYLNNAGVARRAGVRIWDLPGIDKINIPAATATPTVEWLGQNTQQSAADPNLGQMSFSMKTARCLTAIPNELLQVSTPSLDTLLAELIGIAFAEAEDTAFFATSSVTNGPTSLYAASGTTSYNVGGSANGGNLSYADLTTLLWKSSAAKAKPPFVWFMSPRTFFQRIVGLVDSQSRPLFIPQTSGLSAGIQGSLFGYPVFVSPAIPENQALGSGSNQSYVVLTNPKYLHIADGRAVEIAISNEFLFATNQTAIRGVHRCDFGVGPAAGVCILKGVN